MVGEEQVKDACHSNRNKRRKKELEESETCGLTCQERPKRSAGQGESGSREGGNVRGREGKTFSS